jgi:hypothetical protein
MPRLTFSMTLPEPLYSELKQGAKLCDMSPANFAAQALEVMLVSRREFVTQRDVENTFSHAPFEAEVSEA